METWKASKLYITQPFAKRGELDQGILAFAKLSLSLVMQGYFIALIVGTPLGFFLGLSKTFTKAMDPIIQVLRPVSPLAWFPLGLVLFSSVQKSASTAPAGPSSARAMLAALFTIAICAMWPTVMNTAVGVRAVPQDYLNVAKVLKLSRAKTLFKVLLPATLPYMFTGFRLSLGIAWLVIVAVEMLTGRPGVGGFPLAGIQRAQLRAHHPLHPHHRHRRPGARPHDVRGGITFQNGVSEFRRSTKDLRLHAGFESDAPSSLVGACRSREHRGGAELETLLQQDGFAPLRLPADLATKRCAFTRCQRRSRSRSDSSASS